MGEPQQGRDEAEARNAAAEPNFAEASAKFIADQAAVMTMMTAVSVSMATQMAGLFIGAMADALDKQRTVDAPAKTDGAKAPEEPKVVPLKAVRKAQTARSDDLKRISGIGPRLEKVLRDMGITSFADIAKWDDAEAMRIDKKLDLDNRIIRDGWVRQAKALLEG
jgi:NADH-quinone oxidoreductase subunit E